jgi:hypothetical protein
MCCKIVRDEFCQSSFPGVVIHAAFNPNILPSSTALLVWLSISSDLFRGCGFSLSGSKHERRGYRSFRNSSYIEDGHHACIARFRAGLAHAPQNRKGRGGAYVGAAYNRRIFWNRPSLPSQYHHAYRSYES